MIEREKQESKSKKEFFETTNSDGLINTIRVAIAEVITQSVPLDKGVFIKKIVVNVQVNNGYSTGGGASVNFKS